MNDSDFIDCVRGKQEREKHARTVAEGRSQSRRPGLRPAGKLKPVKPYDIGGDDMVDVHGNPLYGDMVMQDNNEDDDISTMRAHWDQIPVDDKSADEGEDDMKQHSEDGDYHTDDMSSDESDGSFDFAATPSSSEDVDSEGSDAGV